MFQLSATCVAHQARRARRVPTILGRPCLHGALLVHTCCRLYLRPRENSPSALAMSATGLLYQTHTMCCANREDTYKWLFQLNCGFIPFTMQCLLLSSRISWRQVPSLATSSKHAHFLAIHFCGIPQGGGSVVKGKGCSFVPH